jgi:hypothetical protein
MLFAISLLATVGCGERPAPAPAAAPAAGGASTGGTGAAPEISSATFDPSLGVDLAAMRQTPRGVYLRDLTEGTGTEAVSGSQVAIHYVGRLANGKQFDANGPNDAPFEFRVNAGEVVPGFDEGVSGMKPGGRRLVIIPPALGYGAQDNGPIPANSILVFTIDLVRVQ